MVDDPVEIVNFRRLDGRVTTSGQPSSAQLAALAATGVRHVINLGLHTHERALADEAGDVAALGMTYHHLPVAFAAPTEEDFAAFRRVFEATAPEKVHVHCIMNWRVSAFFFRYGRDVLGRDPAEARVEMEAIWTPDEVWSRFIAPRG